MPFEQYKYWSLLRMKNATVVSLLIFFLSANSCDQKYVKHRGSARGRLSSGHAPLIDQLSGFLRKIELFMGCSVGLNYAKNALAVGAVPRTPLRELTMLPQTP